MHRRAGEIILALPERSPTRFATKGRRASFDSFGRLQSRSDNWKRTRTFEGSEMVGRLCLYPFESKEHQEE